MYEIWIHHGIWPAFWRLPQKNIFGSWPRSGELNIMEVAGHYPRKPTAHYILGPDPAVRSLGEITLLSSASFHDGFHVFSVDWKKDEIKWLVDGIVFSTHDKSGFLSNNYPFNEEFLPDL